MFLSNVENENLKSNPLSICLDTISISFLTTLSCKANISLNLFKTWGSWSTCIVASKAYSSAKASASVSFLVPALPLFLPVIGFIAGGLKYLINWAFTIFFLSNLAFPCAVSSRSCLPSLFNTRSKKSGNLLFIVFWGNAS